MNEGLFRAKELTQPSKWRFGHYYNQVMITPNPVRSNSQSIEEYQKEIEDNTEHYLIFTHDMDWNLPTQLFRCRIDPKTLGQETGFRDKNGKKVYAGDIIKSTSEILANFGQTRTGKYSSSTYEVAWDKQKCRWIERLIESDQKSRTPGYESDIVAELIPKYYEVIGNIHDKEPSQ